jgi:large subunit ribosomal protein L34
MSCAAALPAVSPVEAGAAALAGLLGDLADRMGEFEMPNVLMAIPGRKGPSNKARAGVSGFRARKLTKTGRKVLRNRRKKGRKAVIPSPGRHPIHGL